MTIKQVLFVVISLAAVAILAAISFISFNPKLVWNASASAPIGLYRIDRKAHAVNDFVLVSGANVAAKFAAERGYLPAGTPLIKRIAALPGDEICRDETAIFINGKHVAEAQKRDSSGRNMPSWSGCFVLQKGEIFLLNAPEKSLDGRYFGATDVSYVIDVAAPVWVWEAAR